MSARTVQHSYKAYQLRSGAVETFLRELFNDPEITVEVRAVRRVVNEP